MFKPTTIRPRGYKRARSKNPAEYKEDLKQNWTNISNGCLGDQCGFEIHTLANTYKLYWRNKFITEVFSIQAAKEISTIILNDFIMYTPKE